MRSGGAEPVTLTGEPVRVANLLIPLDVYPFIDQMLPLESGIAQCAERRARAIDRAARFP